MGQFNFKQFSVTDDRCGMKVGTDAVILGCWTDVHNAGYILDAGCGSGVIALMMAQRAPWASVLGLDISKAACCDARSNIRNSPWSERVEVRCCDILTFDPAEIGRPLLIISNPPFFSETLHSPDHDRTLARHGEDFDVRSLIKLGGRFLRDPDDSMAFIAPAGRDQEIEFLLAVDRLTPLRVTTVFSRKGKAPFRTLWQVKKDDFACGEIERTELFIRGKDNSYTREYLSLTSDFYL